MVRGWNHGSGVQERCLGAERLGEGQAEEETQKAERVEKVAGQCGAREMVLRKRPRSANRLEAAEGARDRGAGEWLLG